MSADRWDQLLVDELKAAMGEQEAGDRAEPEEEGDDLVEQVDRRRQRPS
jgi:hypothetical protein